MEGLRGVLGPIGLVLIFIGGITYGIMYTSGWPAFLPLLAGFVISIISILLNYREAKTEGLRRSARFGINTGFSIIFLAATFIFLQTILSRHSPRIDTTENKRFSLAPQTNKILDQLTSDIGFTCFFKETSPDKTKVADLLKEFSSKSKRIRYLFVDADKDPITARRYKVSRHGTIVIESGEKEEKIYDFTEEKITNAILKVTRDEKKVIYFTTGHGEKSIEDVETGGFNEVKKAAMEENYEVRELLSMRADKIPDDCNILVIAGPEKDFLPQEMKLIADYLESGGKVLFLLDPLIDVPEITGVIEEYGIEVGDNIVVDRYGRLLAGNYLTPVVNKYGDHPITEGFRHASFFPMARSIDRKTDPPAGITIELLGSTGDEAYAETNLMDIREGKTQFEGESDLSGPIDIAVVATKETEPALFDEDGKGEKKFTRLVVFGDSDFAINGNLDLSGNRDLILNTINWLAEEEDLIAIRPRDAVTQPVVLSERQGRVVFWLPVAGIPAFVAIIGIFAAIHKRKSA